MQHTHLRDLAHDTVRNEALTLKIGSMLLDISKQKLDVSILQGLIRLAEVVNLPQAIQSLVRGELVNNTENRPALHSALRLPKAAQLILNGQDVVPAVHESLARMRRIVSSVHCVGHDYGAGQAGGLHVPGKNAGQ